MKQGMEIFQERTRGFFFSAEMEFLWNSHCDPSPFTSLNSVHWRGGAQRDTKLCLCPLCCCLDPAGLRPL